jgi:hypothetical protein
MPVQELDHNIIRQLEHIVDILTGATAEIILDHILISNDSVVRTYYAG